MEIPTEPTPFRNLPSRNQYGKVILEGADGRPDLALTGIDYLIGGELSQVDAVNEYIALLRIFTNESGLSVPNPQFLVGDIVDDSSGQVGPGVYVVQKLVVGNSLSDPDSIDVPEQECLKTFNALLKYYDNILDNGGRFIADLHFGQFVYGHTDEDEQPRTYLVDTDIFVLNHDVDNPNVESLEELSTRMLNLAENLRFMITKYDSSYKDLVFNLLETLRKLPNEDPEGMNLGLAELKSYVHGLFN